MTNHEKEKPTAVFTTELNLFRIGPDTMERLSQDIGNCETWIKKRKVAVDTMAKYAGLIDEKGERVVQKSAQTQEDMTKLQSSIIVGACYLGYTKDLTEKYGCTFQEAHQFFLHSLDLYQRIIQPNVSIGRSKQKTKEVAYSLFESARDIPHWFKGNHDQYADFLIIHCNIFGGFAGTIDSHMEKYGYKLNVLQELRWQTKIDPEQLPDWMEETNIIPTPAHVEAELKMDCDLLMQGYNAGIKLYEQGTRLDHEKAVKLRKVIKVLLAQQSNVPIHLKTFSDFLLACHVFDEGMLMRPNMGNLDELELSQLTQCFITKKDIIEAIGSYYQLLANFQLDIPETVAVFLEHSFKNLGFFQTVKESANRQTYDLFIELFRSARQQKGKNLRKTGEAIFGKIDKRLFSFFNYELKPLLELVQSEDLAIVEKILESEINDNVNQTDSLRYEGIIWYLAEMIAHIPFREIKEAAAKNPNVRDSVRRLGKHRDNWLTYNWRQLYQQLKDMVSVSTQKVIAKPIGTTSQERLVSEANDQGLNESINQLTEEIQVLSEDFPLRGWDIFYLPPKNGKLLINLRGGTGEEMVDAIKTLTQEHGMPLSIKPVSLYNTLEWIATELPDTYEEMAIKQEVGEVTYAKVKRGRMRIFYRIDRQRKILWFFTYHKEDWGYRL